MSIAKINGCVIVPTYNNDKTLARILAEILSFVPPKSLIVINDGSTDNTPKILSELPFEVTIVSNEKNSGKGFSIKRGIQAAINLGFENAITIDSDGQHFPSDLPKLINAAINNPGDVLMGTRNLEQPGVPQKSSFGNKFSNFWFKAETAITLPDTQTGFRLYPLEPLKKLKLFTNKFELEIEIIVRLAWRNCRFIPINVQVKYDPEERVSHFRPGRDFFRISVLNSILFTIACLWIHPRNLILKFLQLVKNETVKPNESNLTKSLSLGFGVFMGIVPIWGFQLIVGIPLAVFFRMNKVLFFAAANISIPPMIPLIIYASYKLGHVFIGGSSEIFNMHELTLESISIDAEKYFLGATILAILSFVIVTLLSFSALQFLKKNKKPVS